MNTHIKEGLGDRIFNGVTLILILLIIVVVAYPLYFVLVASMSSPTAVNSGKILLYPEGFPSSAIRTSCRIPSFGAAMPTPYFIRWQGHFWGYAVPLWPAMHFPERTCRGAIC